MTLQEFIDQYNGKGNIGNTKDNKGQCVGLVMQWLVETLGNPQIWGHAKDLISNTDLSKYDVIFNTDTSFPLPGDVICWNGRMGGGFGHTALVLKADKNSIQVLEQNTNPLTVHISTYPNYNNVQGWIRAKNYQQPTPQQPSNDGKKAVQFDRIVSFLHQISVIPTDRSEDYIEEDGLLKGVQNLDAENKRKATRIEELEADLKAVKEDKDESDKAIITLQTKVEHLNNAMEADAVNDKDFLIHAKELEEQRDKANLELSGISQSLDMETYDYEAVIKTIDALKKPKEEVITYYDNILKQVWDNLYKGKRTKPLMERIKAYALRYFDGR